MRFPAHSLAVIAAALWAAVSIPAHGQVVCAEPSEVVEHLRRNFHERSAGTGLTQSGQAIELFVSETGTWTIVVTTPADQACIVAYGEAWRPPATERRRGTRRSL